MSKEINGLMLCRLLAAWIHGAAFQTVKAPDFDALYHAAERHLLTAATCAALEKTGLMASCPPETAKRFRAAKEKSIRKTILMDAERKELLAFFERQGIWHVPLKGILINVIYPEYGTRQFSDNDIFFDETCAKAVMEHMKRRGYRAESVGKGAHDTYQKPPVYRFEMHRKLFAEDGKNPFLTICTAYYADVRGRLIKDSDSHFGYHFSNEDFYIYFIAHAFQHHSRGGTGLRTLMDIYLYRAWAAQLDEEYIAAELHRLQLTEFERVCRSLAEKLFCSQPCQALTSDEAQVLNWMENSGAYGNMSQRVQGDLDAIQKTYGITQRRARRKYLLHMLFPPMEWYRVNTPFAYRHRWAVPIFWIYRAYLCIFQSGKQNLSILRAYFATPNDTDSHTHS